MMDIEVLPDFFGLDFEICTTDFVVDEIKHSEQAEQIQNFIRSNDNDAQRNWTPGKLKSVNSNLPLDKIEKLAKKWKMSTHNRIEIERDSSIERFLCVCMEDRFAKTFLTLHYGKRTACYLHN